MASLNISSGSSLGGSNATPIFSVSTTLKNNDEFFITSQTSSTNNNSSSGSLTTATDTKSIPANTPGSPTVTAGVTTDNAEQTPNINTNSTQAGTKESPSQKGTTGGTTVKGQHSREQHKPSQKGNEFFGPQKPLSLINNGVTSGEFYEFIKQPLPIIVYVPPKAVAPQVVASVEADKGNASNEDEKPGSVQPKQDEETKAKEQGKPVPKNDATDNGGAKQDKKEEPKPAPSTAREDNGVQPRKAASSGNPSNSGVPRSSKGPARSGNSGKHSPLPNFLSAGVSQLRSYGKRLISSYATGYYPTTQGGNSAKEHAMEGGSQDRFGNRLSTVDDFLNGKSTYISVAMDVGIPENNGNVNVRIPEYEELLIQRYKQLHPDWTPENIAKIKEQLANGAFRIVDTGSAFMGKGYSRIDICCANKEFTNIVTGKVTILFPEVNRDTKPRAYLA